MKSWRLCFWAFSFHMTLFWLLRWGRNLNPAVVEKTDLFFLRSGWTCHLKEFMCLDLFMDPNCCTWRLEVEWSNRTFNNFVCCLCIFIIQNFRLKKLQWLMVAYLSFIICMKWKYEKQFFGIIFFNHVKIFWSIQKRNPVKKLLEQLWAFEK